MIDGAVEIVVTRFLREKESPRPRKEEEQGEVLEDALKINNLSIIW